MITHKALSPSEAINEAAGKFFQFTGRSRRSEFWWSVLFCYILKLLFSLGLSAPAFFPFALLLSFVLDLGMIPLSFRRLHDTGKSGWYIGGLWILMLGAGLFVLIQVLQSLAMEGSDLADSGWRILLSMSLQCIFFSIIIFIYHIVLLVFFCLDSDPYENDYGESPKYEEEETAETAE